MSKAAVEYIPPWRLNEALAFPPAAHSAISKGHEQAFRKSMERLQKLVDDGNCEEASSELLMAGVHVGSWGSHKKSTYDNPDEAPNLSNEVSDKLSEAINVFSKKCLVGRREEKLNGLDLFGGKRIFGLPWWITIGGGFVLLAGIGVGTKKIVEVVGKRMSIARGREKYGVLIDTSAKSAGVPSDVLTLFVALESSFREDEYNPEPSGIIPWSKHIATNEKWKANPDYANAVSVYKQVSADPSLVSKIAKGSGVDVPYIQKLWKFGSFGLGQVSAITARDRGFPYERSNADLFKPGVNLPLAARHIAALRKAIYPDRENLTMAEWSRVRAAYVGGRGILTSNPSRANEIATLFVKKSEELST
jgi:hypothetical protein